MFDDMIADMESNKILSPKVTELFLRGRKLKISLVFISQFYLKVPKPIRLNATHYFIIEIPNKRELQQIASNHLSDIDFKDFMKLYKDYTKEPCFFLVNDTILSTNNPLRFRKKDVLPEKNLLEKSVVLKRSEYSPLDKELKAQTDVAKNSFNN